MRFAARYPVASSQINTWQLPKKRPFGGRRQAARRVVSCGWQGFAVGHASDFHTICQHIAMSELPEQDRFQRLRVAGKHLVDTIKMIAYRAETTLVQIARERMSRTDDGRQLVASLFQTAADLHPDDGAGTLTVRRHHLANHAHDEVVRHLCAELHATATVFPGTTLRLIFELGAE